MASLHQPVLVAEVIKFLNLQPGDKVIDATVGGGGHANKILEAIVPRGKLLGIDRDAKAIELVRNILKKFSDSITLVHSKFSRLYEIAKENNFLDAKAILLDLGWSQNQLQDIERGLSFKNHSPLDLRLDQTQGITAADILNKSSEQELVEIFKNYGEIRKSKALARAIVRERIKGEILSTQDLLAIVRLVLGSRTRKIDAARQVWQALRIIVNDELAELAAVLPQILQVLTRGGRLAVISFHSGEDRIVKSFLKQESKDCLCPPAIPVCQCHHQATLKIITTKAVTASRLEIATNYRARSARLRIAEKI